MGADGYREWVEPGRRKGLPSLTGLRAPAAFAVFAYHLEWLTAGLIRGGYDTVADVIEHVTLRGYVGVSFFFILSGFVLSWSQKQGDPAGRFWWRRAVRVYPNHIVTWFLAGGLVIAGIITVDSIGGAIANLFLLPHFLVPGAGWTVMNDPSWSIEVEVFFYALFPFIFSRIVRTPDRVVIRTMIAAGAVLVGVPLLAMAAGQSTNTQVWNLLYFFPVMRLPEFVVGVCLGTLAKRGKLPRINAGLALTIVLVAYAVNGWVPVVLTFAALTLVPFSFLLVAYAGCDLAGRETRFGGRFWTHLGAVSYAFYAVHFIVIQIARWEWGASTLTPLDALAITVGCFAAALGAAEILHRVVERPAIRLLRDRVLPTRAKAVGT